ncbi:MAG: hypothetical protein IPI49_07795 [Myxococcales bacterium]|nr:hypothetical protein [Myxococcales bacterium]
MTALTALTALTLVGSAAADVRVHGSLGVGPALLLSGDLGDVLRVSAVLEFFGSPELFERPQRLERSARPGRFRRWRLGGGAALHAVGGDERLGLAVARLSMQAAASPPRLWLRLHAEAGLALSSSAPVVGAGASATVRVLGAASVVIEANSHLVVDGVAQTRLLTSAAALAALAW